MDKKRKKAAEDLTNDMSFEKALDALEALADELESGKLGLDESINRFERGMRLAALCKAKLDEAEQKIELLQKKGAAVEKRRVRVKNSGDELEDIAGNS